MTDLAEWAIQMSKPKPCTPALPPPLPSPIHASKPILGTVTGAKGAERANQFAKPESEPPALPPFSRHPLAPRNPKAGR